MATSKAYSTLLCQGGLQLVHVPAQVIPDGFHHLQFFLDRHCLQGEGNGHSVIPILLEGVTKAHPWGAYATFATPSYLEGGGNFTSALTKVWRIRGTAWKHQLAAALDAGCPVTTHPKYRHGAGREKRCRTPKRPVG